MFEFVNDNTLAEYEAFNMSHPFGHFAQSKKWANLKDNWKWEAIIVRDENGAICGSLAVLIRNLPHMPWTLMYGCRGPVCDPHDRATMEQLIEGARVLAKKYHSYVLKIDPDVSIEDKEFIKELEHLGFKNATGDGKNFEGIQPNFVFRLDVSEMNAKKIYTAEPGEAFDITVDDTQGEDAIMHFKTDTRTKVRKAIKRGVKIKLVGKEMMPFFAKMMLETGCVTALLPVRQATSIRCWTRWETMPVCTWHFMRTSRLQVRSRFTTATRFGICTAHPQTAPRNLMFVS